MVYTTDRPTNWNKAEYYGKELKRDVDKLIKAYEGGDLDKMRYAEMQLESTILRFKSFAR